MLACGAVKHEARSHFSSTRLAHHLTSSPSELLGLSAGSDVLPALLIVLFLLYISIFVGDVCIFTHCSEV